mmetsp:Transcript_68594/g.143089  ORF Transcript_68594/g.143089 Transcript_68594/m.143089 type:complete len:333 (-) Transcript_68594:1284-2282(-)
MFTTVSNIDEQGSDDLISLLCLNSPLELGACAHSNAERLNVLHRLSDLGGKQHRAVFPSLADARRDGEGCGCAKDAVRDAKPVRHHLAIPPRLQLLGREVARAQLPRLAPSKRRILEQRGLGLPLLHEQLQPEEVPVHASPAAAVARLLLMRCHRREQQRPALLHRPRFGSHGLDEGGGLACAGADRLRAPVQKLARRARFVRRGEASLEGEEGKLDGKLAEAIGPHTKPLDAIASQALEGDPLERVRRLGRIKLCRCCLDRCRHRALHSERELLGRRQRAGRRLTRCWRACRGGGCRGLDDVLAEAQGWGAIRHGMLPEEPDAPVATHNEL